MTKKELKKYWEGFIKSFKNNISSAHISTYFSGSAPLEVKKDTLILGVPNAFIKATLEKKYGSDILNFFNNVSKNIKKIEIKTIQLKKEDILDVASVLKTSKKESDAKNKEMLPVNKRYSFENFIVGTNNQLAYAAAQAIAKKPGRLYNPLFVYGGVGMGKTHILQAIANKIKEKNPETKIVYVPAETFTNDLIDSIGRKNVRKFRSKYRDNVDVLIIDDVQFIENKEGTQEELFHTFNILHGAQKQIIFSSDRPPVELKITEERLKSRFASGMIADISAPNIETRIAILRAKLQEKGYLVSTDVLNVIAEFIDSNVRELVAVLNQVVDEAELLQIDPTMELVQKIIKRLFPTKIKLKQQNFMILEPNTIINACSEYFNITPEEIMGSSRKKQSTTPRHIAMYLIRELLALPLESIGDLFSKRNHTTVMHGIDKTRENIKNNMNIVKAVNKIKRDLGV